MPQVSESIYNGRTWLADLEVGESGVTVTLPAGGVLGPFVDQAAAAKAVRDHYRQLRGDAA